MSVQDLYLRPDDIFPEAKLIRWWRLMCLLLKNMNIKWD